MRCRKANGQFTKCRKGSRLGGLTRTLPTDRRGAVYYGPKTAAEAIKLYNESHDSARAIAASMRKAGYGRAAAIFLAYVS